MSEDLEKLSEDVKNGLNSLRDHFDKFKDKVIEDITEFKRLTNEDRAEFKYKISKEVNDLITQSEKDIQRAIREAIQSQEEKLSNAKSGVLEKLSNATKNLTDLVNSRINLVGIGTSIMLLALGWVWQYSKGTSDKLDIFKTEIRTEFTSFKDDLKSSLKKTDIALAELSMLIKEHAKIRKE